MELHKISIKKSAFTLIEVLVVLALFGLIASLALIVNFDLYRKKTFSENSTDFIVQLSRARNLAMHNVCREYICSRGSKHGVYVSDTAYTVYEGESYGMRNKNVDESFTFDQGIKSLQTVDINFEQLSGKVQIPVSVTLLSNGGETQEFAISREGVIDW